MTNLIVTLLFILSLPFSAFSASPTGVFQVNSSNSHVTIADNDQSISGFIDINKNFSDSKIKFESGNTSFVSSKVEGTLENFKVSGVLYNQGETQNVTLEGRYFGSIEEENFSKIALSVSTEKCVINIIAQQPTMRATYLHREVRDIFQ